MESPKKTRELPKCPREEAGFFSYLAFIWVWPIFMKGNRKVFDIGDLYQPLPGQKSNMLGSKLEKAWKKNRNLFSCLKIIFGREILKDGLILLVLECGIKILPPIFLSRIIFDFSQDSSMRNQTEVIFYSLGIICASFLNVMIVHSHALSNLNCGFTIRTGICSLIYRRCLKLSKSSLNEVTTGKIVNMMSNDVGKYLCGKLL